jgi:hypothetical protein
VRFEIAGDPAPEEAAAIVAVLDAILTNANVRAATKVPSKWRAAARSFEDSWATREFDLRRRAR